MVEVWLPLGLPRYVSFGLILRWRGQRIFSHLPAHLLQMLWPMWPMLRLNALRWYKWIEAYMRVYKYVYASSYPHPVTDSLISAFVCLRIFWPICLAYVLQRLAGSHTLFPGPLNVVSAYPLSATDFIDCALGLMLCLLRWCAVGKNLYDVRKGAELSSFLFAMTDVANLVSLERNMCGLR